MKRMATQIRLDESLYNKIKYVAEKELRTLNAQMEYFLRATIDNYEEIHGEITDQDIMSIYNADEK